MGATSKNPGADPWGVVCALPEELGSLARSAVRTYSRQGFELRALELDGEAVLACICGVGKVPAAHGTALLLSEGVRRGLFVVGVCGGLRQALSPGTLVHCERAIQADSAVRASREAAPDPELARAWREVAGGELGWFVTADRPVLSLWRRLRLARAFRGACVADMETAAAGAVCARAGVPWAALRAVTDRATGAGLAAFKAHFPSQAGRAADTIPRLLEHLRGARGDGPGSPRQV